MKVPILDLQPACEELRPELDAAYRRVVDSGWVLLGRELESFELEYARSIGVKHCVGVANGLEALQMALLALDIGPGDEVIVPSHGYIATWLAVTHTGARPVPCEPDPHTYNLDPSHLPSLVTSRTRAILPIHLYGQTADMEAIRAGAARHNLLVIEDGGLPGGDARGTGTPGSLSWWGAGAAEPVALALLKVANTAIADRGGSPGGLSAFADVIESALEVYR
jgi:dTDP-4-amino-4,6-dideoxygalactose transaminase